MAESSKAVYAALAGNIAVAVTKLAAAAFTGSSSMFSEGLHSAVDSGNECLLLLGKRRSRRTPDDLHPFGYGQELYFWALIVSVIFFAAGGGVSAYEGILRLMHPEPPRPSMWNYVVLALAAVFESASLYVGVKQFRETYPNQPFLHAVQTSKDPTTFTVVFEDAAALAGLAVAFAGIFLAQCFHDSLFDGLASVAIGGLLMAVAVLLARESKGLLTGEAADPEMLRRIRRILESDPAAERVNNPLTMYFGPDNILLAVEIQFRRDLTAGATAEAVDRLESAVRKAFPKVRRIFIEAEAIGAGTAKRSPDSGGRPG